MGIKEIAEYLGAGKMALDLLKSARDALPKGANADQLQEKIDEAERALGTSKAAAAKALGFKLCQCTFPPQVMLWREPERAHICPGCGHKVEKLNYTPPIMGDSGDGRNSWMGR
jgi:hypothetical protein